MQVDVNIIAVLFATVSSFFVGFVWYMPQMFGETWRKLVGMNKQTMQKGPQPRAWTFTVIAAILQAYILAYVTYLLHAFFADVTWLFSSIITAVVLWLGMQVPVLLTHDSFEQRRLKLTVINAGNQLVTLLCMALIIGLIKP